jgi:hypothetical protein
MNFNVVSCAQELGLIHNQDIILDVLFTINNSQQLNFTILSVSVILKLENSKFVSQI